MAKKVTKNQLIGYARRLRTYPTKSEDKARKLLRKYNIPYKFQVPFKYYILDFIITNRLLVVEIDGGYHKDRKHKDKIRDNFCKTNGLKVLRIKNHEVNTLIKKIKAFKKVPNSKVKLNSILNNL